MFCVPCPSFCKWPDNHKNNHTESNKATLVEKLYFQVLQQATLGQGQQKDAIA